MSSSSPDSSSPRRSSRSRRPANSYYEEAKVAREARDSMESSEQHKNKRKREKPSPDKHEEDDDDDAADEAVEDMQVQDDDDDQEEQDDESGDDNSDDEQVEVAPPKRKRARSTSRKIQLAADDDALPPRKPKKAPTTPARGRRAVQTALTALAKKVLDASETPQDSLVAALLDNFQEASGKTNNAASATTQIAKIARRVVQDHQQDPNKAQVDLFNLLFRSVGGSVDTLMDPKKFDLEDMSEKDWEAPIKALVQAMGETPLEATLICADPMGALHESSHGTKHSAGAVEYRQRYEAFWYQLGVVALAGTTVKATNDSESDGEDKEEPVGSERFQVELVRAIVSRVVELVGIRVHDIRAAATVAVYQLGIAMLERTVALKEKLKAAERQLKVARKSKMNRKAEALKTQVDTWKRSVEDLDDLVSSTVMGVFFKRYRDVNQYIRADSLKILSRFTLIRPDLFLTSTYLKYFGWMLSDKEAVVRQAAVASLLAPFGDTRPADLDTSAMSSVFDRFAPRLADCTFDVDSGVQEVATELLLTLAQHSLLDHVPDEVFEQINLRALAPVATPKVRRFALFFVLEQLESFDSIDTKRSESHDVARIQDLAQWIVTKIADSELVPEEDVKYEVTDHVVSSLRSEPKYKRLICNWSALLKALETDKKTLSKQENRVDVIQKRVILRMFMHAAELEVLETADESVLSCLDAQPHAAKPKKRSKKDDATHEELTLALLRAFPRLIVAFQSESASLESLTRLPRFFLPSVFNLASRKRDFQKLASGLRDIFLDSTHIGVLNNCCLALTTLANGDHARSDDALVLLTTTARELRDRLVELYEEKAKLAKTKDDDDATGDENASVVETETSINLCLRRLKVLSKHWYIAELLFDNADQEALDKDVESLLLMVAEDCGSELVARKVVYEEGEAEEEDEQQITIPKIWSAADTDLHGIVASSIGEALDFLLATTAWRLNLELEREKKNESVSEDDFVDHVVVRMREHLVKLASLCFEQFIEPKESGRFSEEHFRFSETVHIHAGRTSADLRTLFPKAWSQAASRFLASCALTDDASLIGGFVRFLRSRESELRANEEAEEEDTEIVKRILLPVGHALAGNWKAGNRREAGACLSHIVGSGQEASSLVGGLSRVLKKIEPVRLLEAHMACLRQEFQDWIDCEPEELESDRPTEGELAAFEEAEKEYATKFDDIEQEAARLSQSLGVGKLSNQLSPALLGFVKEGLRFAFSVDEPGYDEDLPLGARLPFLRIVAKYLTWTRRNNACTTALRADFNQRETDLRNHQDFVHVPEEDKEALAVFRKTGSLGVFLVEDEDEDESKDRPRRAAVPAGFRAPRTSFGSSVSSIPSKKSAHTSLSPLLEEDDDDDDADHGEDDIDRRGTLTSTTSLSVSTLGRTQEPLEADETSEAS